MNEKLTIKENTNVIDDSSEIIAQPREIGEKLLSIIDTADIKNTDDLQSEDWDDFQVTEEGTDGDRHGTVTLVPTEMIEEIESVDAV